MRTSSHYVGRVVWFSSALGYGFLERHDGTDVLCPFSAVINPGYKLLSENESVEFDVVQGEHGPCAANVVRIAPQPNQELEPLPALSLREGTSAQATISMWRRRANKAKRLLRKASLPLTKVTYRNGDFSDCLSVSSLAIEEQPDKIVVSLDLSPNEDRRSAAYSSFSDVMGLKKNVERLNFIQVRRDSWLDGEIVQLQAKFPARLIELAIRFKDGIVRTLPARLEQDSSSYWFYAVEGAERHAFPWWRKPRR